MEAIGRGGCGCCPSTGEGRLSTRTVDLRVSRPFFCAPRLQANFPPRNSDLDHLAAAAASGSAGNRPTTTAVRSSQPAWGKTSPRNSDYPRLAWARKRPRFISNRGRKEKASPNIG